MDPYIEKLAKRYEAGELVTRYDVLDAAIKYKEKQIAGLCWLISFTLYEITKFVSYDILLVHLDEIFPYFTRKNAIKISKASKYKMFWWKEGRFGHFSRRMKFLRWLRDQYKNDKTDIRIFLKNL